MVFIETMREGDNINEVYYCKEKVEKTSIKQKNYYDLKLQDKTGLIDGKVWDINGAIDDFDDKEYINVTGVVTSFNGALQLKITRIRRAQEGEYDEANYMPTSDRDMNEMKSELAELIASVKNEHLNKLLKSFFVEDEDFLKQFTYRSAAKSVHHAFIGGLMEHSLSVAKHCVNFCKIYPILNHDLLISAALFHDIGKVKEFSAFPTNDYTDEGQLLGHIVMGAMMISERIERDFPDFPENTKNELLHCILSHHGKLEFGSPKKPEIIEAFALNYADDLDAKIETFKEALEESKTMDTWKGYNKFFESYIRVTKC